MDKRTLCKKGLSLFLALAVAAPVLVSASSRAEFEDEDDDDSPNATFTVTAVSPETFTNIGDTTVTVTGTGFDSISQLKVQLGEWDDDSRDESDDAVIMTSPTVVGATQITAVIPVGSKVHDHIDLTVVDEANGTHVTYKRALSGEGSIDIDDNEDSAVLSSRSSAKTSMTATLEGRTIEKKGWVKARIGSRPVKIVSISRSGTNTVVKMRLRYGKLAAGSYDLVLTYKDQVVEPVLKNKKVKYQKFTERGTIRQTDAFEVTAQ